MGQEGHPGLIQYLAQLLLLVVGQVAPMEPLRQIRERVHRVVPVEVEALKLVATEGLELLDKEMLAASADLQALGMEAAAAAQVL